MKSNIKVCRNFFNPFSLPVIFITRRIKQLFDYYANEHVTSQDVWSDFCVEGQLKVQLVSNWKPASWTSATNAVVKSDQRLGKNNLTSCIYLFIRLILIASLVFRRLFKCACCIYIHKLCDLKERYKFLSHYSKVFSSRWV